MTDSILPYLLVLPALGYQLYSLVAVIAFFARENPPTGCQPPMTIIKPLKGADEGLYENLASFCCQRYPQFQLVLAVASPDDPAVAVVRRLQNRFLSVDITLVINDASYGANLKVANLINACNVARYNIVAISDSDVRVETDYLTRLASYFADPGVGLVTNLYRNSAAATPAAALEALGFTLEMVPNVIVAERLEGLTFALGASMACRRQAIDAIGGLQVLADYLADDYQLGNRIAKAGWQVVLSPHFVESVSAGESILTVLARQLRWCRTMRVSRPGGYFASVVKEPLTAVIAVFAVCGTSPPAAAAVVGLYLVRIVAALLLSRLIVKDRLLPLYLWLLPLRDLASNATWLLAFCGNRVSWRGDRFRIRAGGKMEQLQ
jgi:ceramide glucosyltransferase